MKINYVIEDFSVCGGVERIVSEKANILTGRYGHEVTIISVYEDERPVRYRLDRRIRVIRLNVPMARKSGSALIQTFDRIKTIAKAARRLNDAVKGTRPDIMFFATTLGALLLPLCRTKARKVYESHLPRICNPYNAFFGITERCADMVVCLTRGDAGAYTKAKEVRVIPNFLSCTPPCVRDYGVRKAVAVGRLERQKGFDILIDIWKDVAPTHPDWQLHIYGEGPLRENLQRQIDISGLAGHVVLCGSCSDMTARYAGYSVHLMTSRHEGLPMTLIEAQAAGLPSVVFNFRYGAADIVSDGSNGFLIEQGDKALFARKLSETMDDAALRMSLGQQARKESARFRADNIMEKWEELIDRACRRPEQS